MVLPDREHVCGWAAILAELNRDDTRVDKEVKVEALAPIEEEKPVGPADSRGLAGTCDEGGRGGGLGEANRTALEADFRTAVPVTGGSIAGGERRDERALEDIDGGYRIVRVEKRSSEEGNGLLDGLSENRRHGECDR